MRRFLRNPLIGFLVGLCIGLAACVEPVRWVREAAADWKQSAADFRQATNDLRSMFNGKP